MTWEIWVAIVAMVGTLIGVLTPLFKLSAAITKLTVTVDILNKSLSRIEESVDKNTQDINEIKVKIGVLEVK